jgi:uncharacterized Fe-S cluster-containing radical SAM superfamily protein
MLWGMLRSRIYDEGLRFRSEPSRPHAIAIEITNACNLRCTMCNLIKMERPPRMMDMDVYRTIIDRCAEAGIRIARLHTFGETLIHPRLVEMLEYAREQSIETWISTNGLLLDEDMGRRLLRAGISMVRFSVEGATKETYEKIRVNGHWETLLTNMKRFREMRDEINPETRIGLNTVVMKDTIDEIPRMRSVFGRFVDEIEFSALEGLGATGMELSKDQFLETLDWDGRIPCRLLWDVMCVNVDGSASVCVADVEMNHVVGNVVDDDLLTLWRGPVYRSLRLAHRRGRFESICTTCTFGVTNTAKNRLRYALLNDNSSYDRVSLR